MKKTVRTQSASPTIQREMDGLGPELWLRDPVIAVADDIGAQYLEGIQAINAALLRALISAAQDSTVSFPLDASLRPTVAALSEPEVESLARCQSWLIDVTSLIPEASMEAGKGDNERPCVWLSPILLNSMAWQSVLLAWHACQLTRGACILLGCSISVARRLASYPIVQLPSLVHIAEQQLRVRWARRPEIWKALIQSARQGTHLRRVPLQLLALRCEGLHVGDRT